VEEQETARRRAQETILAAPAPSPSAVEAAGAGGGPARPVRKTDAGPGEAKTDRAARPARPAASGPSLACAPGRPGPGAPGPPALSTIAHAPSQAAGIGAALAGAASVLRAGGAEPAPPGTAKQASPASPAAGPSGTAPETVADGSSAVPQARQPVEPRPAAAPFRDAAVPSGDVGDGDLRGRGLARKLSKASPPSAACGGRADLPGGPGGAGGGLGRPPPFVPCSGPLGAGESEYGARADETGAHRGPRAGESPGAAADGGARPPARLCADAGDGGGGDVHPVRRDRPRPRPDAVRRGAAEPRAAGPGVDPAEELLVGASPSIRALRAAVRQVADSGATVLVTGPTGAGKENVARALHLLSARATCPFVAINCGAIPAELAEAELFGADAGAYTGAARARPGAFEQAHGGTLFLDELGELPPALQVKLLRVLETREVARLGSARPRRVDVRVVAATNRPLEEDVTEGRFRADLYWRLAVVCLHVPPLADRREDVPLLLAHFAARQGAALALTDCGAAALMRHAWPGNVRELRNLAERALAFGERRLDAQAVGRLLAHGPRSTAATGRDPFPAACRPRAAQAGVGQGPGRPAGRLPAGFADARPLEPVALKALLREAEAALIVEALKASGGTVAEAGRMLGLKRTTLVEKMRRMGLRPPANEAA